MTPAATVRAAIGVDEILLALALALVTAGLWPLCGQSALIAPGLALTWIAMPSRTAFVIQQFADPREAPRRPVTVRPPQSRAMETIAGATF